MRSTRSLAAGSALAVLMTGMALAPGASAKGLEVRTEGSCSGSADWKLKAKTDDGRLEVELEVDSNVVGQSWSVTIKNQGATVFTGNRVTLAPSGSFEVDRRITNRAGADTITALATHAASGQTCRGSLTFPG